MVCGRCVFPAALLRCRLQELRERIMDEFKQNRVLENDPDAPRLIIGPLTDVRRTLRPTPLHG
jgi:hypothetical protein